jgi:hypothetical protein
MALTLTITDKADGTGATATIAGADAATVSLYVIQWSLKITTATWSAGGSRTGNGTIALALGLGVYFGYCTATVSGSPAVSSVVTFGVTNPTVDPLHYRCMQAIKSIILGLGLAEITSGNVLVLKHPYRIENFIGDKGIIISPLPEGLTAHDNKRSEYSPSVQVVLFRKSSQVLEDDVSGGTIFRQDLNWRFRLAMALQETSLPTVTEVCRVSVQPGPLIIPEAFKVGYDAGGIVFRCQSYQEQTLYP